MSRTLCRLLGLVFLGAGVAGFADPHLFGLHLTTVHSVIHIVSGLVTLYVGFAGSADAVRGLGLFFGSAYAFLGLLGFVAPELVSVLLGHPEGLDAAALAPDNILHVLLGSAFLLAGLSHPAPRPASITRLDLQ